MAPQIIDSANSAISSILNDNQLLQKRCYADVQML